MQQTTLGCADLYIREGKR